MYRIVRQDVQWVEINRKREGIRSEIKHGMCIESEEKRYGT